MEKFEIDSKWRNLKKKAYSGVGLRKNILLWSRNRNRSKNHHYSPAWFNTRAMHSTQMSSSSCVQCFGTSTLSLANKSLSRAQLECQQNFEPEIKKLSVILKNFFKLINMHLMMKLNLLSNFWFCTKFLKLMKMTKYFISQ